jgi:hypothetical protein
LWLTKNQLPWKPIFLASESGIPPFAVIIFDIELVKVKANKPEAVQPK